MEHHTHAALLCCRCCCVPCARGQVLAVATHNHYKRILNSRRLSKKDNADGVRKRGRWRRETVESVYSQRRAKGVTGTEAAVAEPQ